MLTNGYRLAFTKSFFYLIIEKKNCKLVISNFKFRRCVMLTIHKEFLKYKI